MRHSRTTSVRMHRVTRPVPAAQHAEDAGLTEPMPFTHALVAALSGGGVAPGDPVGDADVPLVMMAARADGAPPRPVL